MMCSNCVKLAFFESKKPCIACQGEILNNLSVLCEFCSNSNTVCSVCLKNINHFIEKKTSSVCGPCGRKRR